MKWTPWLFGSLTAIWLAGCGGDKRSNHTGAAAGTVTDSSAMQSGANPAADTTAMEVPTDTGMTGSMTSDTARTGSRIHKDTSAGQPSPTGVKSKSDTVRSSGDTATGSNR